MSHSWGWDDPADADLLDDQADRERDAWDDARADEANDEAPSESELLSSWRQWNHRRF